MSDPEPQEPVTVSVARKVLPGREAAYEEWIKGISAAASSFPGHMGLNVLRPSARTNHEYVLIYRFDTYEHGRAWEESEERAHWLEKLADVTAGETTMKKVTGLEFWFDLPAVPAAAKAPQWKMALVLIAVVFVLVYPLQLTVGAWLAGGPFWLRVLVIVVLQVLLMTYVVMPRVTALLKGWLFKPAK
ncbi:antibiotic biosynthesis monooxygenase [Rhodobium gokarnense]|uniref:Antibiotic biosynthesis monooxygenase (ABM) superfamily enzyme n=1 Tax=Rhodobium gokarnense TaxID=364296 RepID=A0ABT3HFF0_9HYPH|nr:antibiotic biosynthesis monooxygenase [Rhodobium gokarnense]MCW2309110.1 antibiotic biosynthesis monooxygenase (ABM) superfamily enzyme [Rhodobium gokarnense]